MTIIFFADTVYKCNCCNQEKPDKFILTGHNETYCRLCGIKHLTHKINDYEDLLSELKK